MNPVESETLEFKREYSETIRNTVIAFANCNGGTILVGVDDDGVVVGLDDVDKTALRITNMIRNSIRPDITLFTRFEPVDRNGRHFLRITVERGSGRPYYIAKRGLRPAGVYVRQGPSSVQASDFRIRELIRENFGDEFESARSLVQDLSFREAESAFEDAKVEFGMPQRKTLGLIAEDGTYTNLALLLSDQCPFTSKIAVWGDDSKMSFRDRLETTGSILKQIEKAVAFVERWNSERAEYRGLRRIDFRDYPPEAIREALLNSFVHRDYSLPDSNLTSIFQDRVEILSIGGLVPWFDDNDFSLGVSALRNKKLAGVFYRLGLIEAFGTGLLKIRASYDGAVKKPLFEHSAHIFKLTLFNLNCVGNTLSEPQTGLHPGDRGKRILALMADGKSISRKDVRKHLDVSEATATRDLNKLLSAGKIARDGGGPAIRYRMV